VRQKKKNSDLEGFGKEPRARSEGPERGTPNAEEAFVGRKEKSREKRSRKHFQTVRGDQGGKGGERPGFSNSQKGLNSRALRNGPGRWGRKKNVIKGLGTKRKHSKGRGREEAGLTSRLTRTFPSEIAGKKGGFWRKGFYSGQGKVNQVYRNLRVAGKKGAKLGGNQRKSQKKRGNAGRPEGSIHPNRRGGGGKGPVGQKGVRQ